VFIKHKRLSNISLDRGNKEKLFLRQGKIFESLGIDLNDTHDKLIKLYAANPDLNNKYKSIHHNLIIGLSNSRFKEVLEIGTHAGVGSTLLAISFPNARITTIDLPDNSEVYNTKKFGIPGNDQPYKRKLFIESRDKLLKMHSNINSMQFNSTFLSDFPNNYFDFIFVDGDHKSPQVIIDTFNAIRLVKVGGIIIFDDLLVGNDAHNIINYFVKLNLIDLISVHKSISDVEDLKKIGVSRKQSVKSFFN